MTSNRITLEDGKYAVENNDGILSLYRNGESWEASGLQYSGLVLALVHEIERLRAVDAVAGEPVADGGWRHIANEWADMAANVWQGVRNIRDGISSADEVLAEAERNYAHCRDVEESRATPPRASSSSAEPAVEEVGFTREQWVHHATRVYLACGDSDAEAAQCAEALADEQDWHGELDEPYEMALADIEGRGNPPRAVAGEPVGQAANPDVAKMVGEAKEILEETYRFAATSPRSQENINAVCDLLDKIEAATARQDSSEAAKSIQRALNQWPGEAGVWIQRRTALACLDALGALTTPPRAGSETAASTSEREKRQTFHRHLQSRGIPSDLFQQDDAGTYEFATVEHDWQVWCAALATASASVQGVMGAGVFIEHGNLSLNPNSPEYIPGALEAMGLDLAGDSDPYMQTR